MCEVGLACLNFVTLQLCTKPKLAIVWNDIIYGRFIFTCKVRKEKYLEVNLSFGGPTLQS